MNKRLFYYLFAVLCTVTLFTSCSDDDGDDTPTVIPIEQEIAGDYKGTMDVYYVGVPDPIASGLSQKVYVTKASDTAVKLELRDFVFFLGSEELNLGTIAVENCPVTVEGTSYKFSGNQKMTLLVGDCDVAVSGTIGSGNLAMIVDVKVGGGTLQVKVDYKGTKLAGTESTEAKILSFTFDKSVEANAVVFSEPIVNEEDGTIVFEVLKDVTTDDLKKLVPTIEVSAKATVTPASGATVDFSSNKAIFTVVAEDGSSKIYTASISGRAFVVSYDFEEWVSESHKPTIGSALAYDIPEGWRTSNPGIVEMKLMVGEKPWSVLKVTDSDRNSAAAQIQTIDSDGKDLTIFKIPKVTAGSLFLGNWKTNASNTLNSTKFGIEYDNSLGKPVTVKGWYKYESGKDYYTCEAPYMTNCPNATKVEGQEYVDEYSIKVSLYTTEEFDNTTYADCLTGEEGEKNFYASSRVVGKGGVEGGSTDGQWKEFTITLDYGNKEFDSNQKYRFAIVCSSSKDGDKFWGAPGSKLWVDDIEVIYKK